MELNVLLHYVSFMLLDVLICTFQFSHKEISLSIPCRWYLWLDCIEYIAKMLYHIVLQYACVSLATTDSNTNHSLMYISSRACNNPRYSIMDTLVYLCVR